MSERSFHINFEVFETDENGDERAIGYGLGMSASTIEEAGANVHGQIQNGEWDRD